MRIIDQELLNRLSSEAGKSQRLRKNYNFHHHDDFPCQRLLNAIEPGTYIHPHRHMDQAKDETMVMVRGRMGVLFFDEAGNVRNSVIMSAGGANVAIDIPHGIFHSIVSLESGTVFFESKAGPYQPLTDEEKGKWAPAEGRTEAASYLQLMERHLMEK